MDRPKQHLLNTKCQALCFVFEMLYEFVSQLLEEIMITFYKVENQGIEGWTKLHKVTQVETGLKYRFIWF